MVSIIIPVYNVRDYIVQCLESVAAQTYCLTPNSSPEGEGSLECLIIDDCGQDDSIQLAEEFVRGYKGSIEFRIIHHEKNKGLSAARNTGIREANGDWLYFLDSDDWITNDCIELMMEQTKMHPDVDMVMGKIRTVGAEYEWRFAEPGIYTDGFIGMSCSYKIYSMAWNKLLSKHFLLDNHLYFEEGLIHEDLLWFIQCACFLKKMVSLKEETYNYIVRKGSLQTDKSYEKHYRNKALVKVKTIDFIFKNHFEDNAVLFSYVYDDLYENLLEPMKQGHKNLSDDFYRTLRKAPFWSLRFIRKQNSDNREIIYAFHRFLPVLLGLTYLQKTHAFFAWKDKRNSRL